MPNGACLTRVAASQVADLVAQVRRGHHRAQPNSQRAGMSQLAGKLEVTNWQSSFEYRPSCFALVPSYPIAASGTGDKRGNSRRAWPCRPPRPSPAFRQLALHHHPRTCVVAAASPGGRRRASRRSDSVRTPPPWVVGAGSGRVSGPKFAARTAAGAACRISGSLGGPEIR
jgi:hypothetical protein